MSRGKPELGSPSSPPAGLSSPSLPNMAPGSTSSRASSPSSPVRFCATSASPPNRSSRTASWPPSTPSTTIRSFTHGPTSSIRPRDMIRTSETLIYLALFSLDIEVGEDQLPVGVIVVLLARGELVMPDDLAGLGAQCQHRG